MSMAENFIGVDIAKNWIDVFHLNTGRSQRILSTKHKLTKFASTCGNALVVLEHPAAMNAPCARLSSVSAWIIPALTRATRARSPKPAGVWSRPIRSTQKGWPTWAAPWS